MTIEQVISKADDLAPNQYTTEQKTGWLSGLDGQVWDELFANHHGREGHYNPVPPEGYTSEEAKLLIPEPYGTEVYVNYILGQVAAMNGEITKYTQFMTLYNAAMTKFSNYWNRTHMPRQTARWRY